ncbi:MAG: Two-component sensor histidine kinase [Candidatus Gottesmanbacteria bacterium GW2011_GWA2_44_17]|uniref:histidine kinase n=3 Tax=Microgenomates group TaxID=1794810 RepID=A0A0G1HG02_9BACT|nr:MAG: Two-component sensor histidine kinase [Candidatus Gottesmanbacteria bacterium GW2011_GWA2_44_17]OGD55767.1 MAG: hypothetical protein A3E73_03285 [Candidatus Beckwithbacteria bacterium RIFCSPHIGHO2_12_FULL_47_17]OGD61615.1 MAG: hypothetical protein A3I57_02810 [Candidatus Beckwithbacteria bacterium RIFCSPLOWO2_02_FULL_47_23]
MFKTARLKLTAWYLVIIMTISILFSLVVFNRFHRELGRFDRRFPFPPSPEIIIEIRQRLALTLIFINGTILVLAGGLGYFLAGKTLKPIEEMMDEQNRFISDASHELKTPLTSLKTAFEVYLRRKKSVLAKESLVEVNKLQSLSENLLKLTHNQSISLVPVSLKTVIDQARKRVESLAQAKKIQITANKTLAKIKGNQEQLTELLVILLDNSIKYSPARTAVDMSVKKIDSQARITIKDQGMGIAPKDLPHIFDRFYRADQARTKTAGGGYGLGLAIAKKIVIANRGAIKVSSRLGQGTTFQLTFSLIN